MIRTYLETLVLIFCIAVTVCGTGQETFGQTLQKGAHTKASSNNNAVLSDGELLFGRILLNPMAPNPLVPRVDVDTIGPYASHADRAKFARAHTQAGRLVFLEEWERDSTPVSLDQEVDGRPLADYAPGPSNDTPQPFPPLFFMPTVDSKWRQVDVAETEGEGRFIRVRMVKGLRTSKMTLEAEQIDQYVIRRSEHEYALTGSLERITTRERANDFEPRVEIISE